MSQQTVLERILEAVSNDSTLRDDLMTHLMDNNSAVSGQHGRNSSAIRSLELAKQTYQSGHGTPELAAQRRQPDEDDRQQHSSIVEPPLVSHEHQ